MADGIERTSRFAGGDARIPAYAGMTVVGAGGKDGCGWRRSCPFILNIVEGWADKSGGPSHPLILNIVEGWADKSAGPSHPFILNIVEGWADKSAGPSHPLILNLLKDGRMGGAAPTAGGCPLLS